MAAHDTRMLLLGAVALFEPVNGYQIRRELMSWRVDEWGHVNPGSVYNGLATLAGQGHLVRHDLVDGTREVAVYELTDSGRAELYRLLALGIETVSPYDGVAFRAAIGLLPLISRPEAIALLDLRLRNLEARIAEVDDAVTVKAALAPPHAMRMMALHAEQMRTERRWLVELIDDVRSGLLSFRGERLDWAPADDDPGWQMQLDRERYRALLGG